MEDTLALARELVLQYGNLVRTRDIHAILATLSEDVSLLLPDAPLMKGKSAIREFYESRFNQAEYTFDVAITDAKVVSDVYFINGTMTRHFIDENVEDPTLVLDFSFILKKEDGSLRIWQMRVA